MKNNRTIGIISWGPIESLSNGYFIRVYALAELLSKKINRKLFIIEYTENLNVQERYKVRRLKDLSNTVKILVPGNETSNQNIIKYIKLIIYQFINLVKLRTLLSKMEAVIVGGVPFSLSLLILRVMNNKLIIIADPHMLISEREERAGRKVLAHILRILETFYFKKSDLILAISADMKDKIIRYYNISPTKVIVVPHILPRKLANLPRCRRKAKAENSHAKTITLAFVGSLRASQNLEAALFLISIMPLLLLKSNRLINLILIGAVGEKEKRVLRKIASRKRVLNNVKIMGYVKNLDDVLCDADILLAPMFSTSGVSTKMIYYLRFRDKLIVCSKEALEGLEYLTGKSKNIIVAENPKDFVLKLLETIVRRV